MKKLRRDKTMAEKFDRIVKLSAFYPPEGGLDCIIVNLIIKSAVHLIQNWLARGGCIKWILLYNEFQIP